MDSDTVKVQEISSSKSPSEGKPLYVNICSSKVVEDPVDADGGPVKGNFMTAPGVSIPLAVGEKRATDGGSAVAVDVVVSKLVLDSAIAHPLFQKQLVDLCLHWVQNEIKVECTGAWSRLQDARYHGGRGDGGDVPVLFFVQTESDPKSGPGACGTARPMDSATDLLKTLNQEHQREQNALDGPLIINKADKMKSKCTKDSPAKPLIQEIGADGVPVESEKINRSSASSGTAAAAGCGTNHIDDFEQNAAAAFKCAGDAGGEGATGRAAEPSRMEYRQMEDLLRAADDEFEKDVVGDDDALVSAAPSCSTTPRHRPPKQRPDSASLIEPMIGRQSVAPRR